MAELADWENVSAGLANGFFLCIGLYLRDGGGWAMALSRLNPSFSVRATRIASKESRERRAVSGLVRNRWVVAFWWGGALWGMGLVMVLGGGVLVLW